MLSLSSYMQSPHFYFGVLVPNRSIWGDFEPSPPLEIIYYFLLVRSPIWGHFETPPPQIFLFKSGADSYLGGFNHLGFGLHTYIHTQGNIDIQDVDPKYLRIHNITMHPRCTSTLNQSVVRGGYSSGAGYSYRGRGLQFRGS